MLARPPLLLRMRRTARALAGALALLVPLALAAGAGADDEEPGPPVIYKWVDENGIAHYTTDRDRIPSQLRNRFDLPEGPPAPPAPSPSLSSNPSDGPDASGREDFREPPTPGVPLPERVAEPREPTSEPAPSVDAPPLEFGAEPAPEEPPAAPLPPPALALERGSDALAEMDVGTPVRVLPGRAVPEAGPGEAAPGELAPGEVAERDMSAESDFAEAVTAASADLDERIRRLEDEIEADEAALKALLAAPSGEAPLSVADDPDLRAIAERLPQRIDELATLRAERGEPGRP